MAEPSDARPGAPVGNGRTKRVSAAVLALVLGLAAVGCSDDESSVESTAPTTAPSSTTPATGAPAGAVELPIIDQIPVAVAALEQQLGGPQDYFEINATARLVNLFVALNNGTVAQAWLYLDGTLTSEEGQPAGGGTFTAASADFDPDVVLSRALTELPDITIESFYIHGDGQGNVLYGVLATSAKGGGLDVVLGADGSVKSVDPVT
jgi:hypothetical protein